MRTLLCLLAVLISSSSFAADTLVRLETRAGVRVPVYYMKRDGATATVILLPGGAGGFGKLVDGKPSGDNFLVRTRDFFADAGLNVAVMSRASDMNDLDYADRTTPEHVKDIKMLVDYLKADSGLPVWLVGTSRGTVSATAAAIAFGNDKLAGIVLTSSVVRPKQIGAVQNQDLATLRMPVLVLHHEKDDCKVCNPQEVPAIINGLRNAPVKKLIMVSEGGNPTGDPCGNQHYHGYIGMEKTAVQLITAWIKHPTP
jgi:hypothetical protein